MAHIIHNVIFDGPVNHDRPINLGNNNIVMSIDRIWNVKIFRIFIQLYIASLLGSYICVYANVPFDNIKGRPPIVILACGYSLFAFSVNTCVLPTCSSAIPTLLSFRCLVVSLMLQLVSLGINVAATVRCVNTSAMTTYEYSATERSSVKVDVTLYVQVVAIVQLVFNLLSIFILGVLIKICSGGLKQMLTKVNRKDNNRMVKMCVELPPGIQREQSKAIFA